MQFYVYILRSESSGKTYVGQTSDLGKRLEQHNDVNCRFTMYTKRNKGPWKLIHSEAYSSRSEAMNREKHLKSGQGRDWIKANFLQKDGGC
ncbi:MAG: GIY-YIG nuclease family protein [Candidatus Hydrogenedentes bacterium]|nr:GIY-YIG nuclease family protein [Candidatus Hydrogenedentota bacterium]